MFRLTDVKGSPAKISVTFEARAGDDVQAIHVVGTFNDWSRAALAMKRRKDGVWAATLRLPRGETHQYCFLLDGERWVADQENGDAIPNPYGGVNSLLRT